MKILYGVQRPDDGTITVGGTERTFHLRPTRSRPASAWCSSTSCWPTTSPCWRTSCSGPSASTASATAPGDGSPRSPTRTGSGSSRTGWWPSSASGRGSGSRSSRCSTAAREIIILDEPTAVLVPQEVDELFDNLRELKDEGLSVIFISHKLDEVLAVADEITVMRRGTTVATVTPADVTARQLAELMVGSELPSPATEDVDGHRPGPALRPRSDARRGGAARPLLSDVSFDIHAGEVLGIAGVEGNGQAELVETIMGMRRPTERHDRPRRRRHHRTGRPVGAGRPGSGSSPRTGIGTGCCSRLRSGRTGSSATRPRSRTSTARSSTVGRPARTPSASSRSTTSGRRASTSSPRRCPAATSRS